MTTSVQGRPLRAIVLGSRGMLGSDLVQCAPAGTTLWTGFPNAEQLDIRNARSIARLLDEFVPSIVLNAAAYTKVDDAEQNVEIASAVNGTAVGALGTTCAARSIPVVHFSTDYVVPGTGGRPYREVDPVSPVNAYGESKLLGERLLRASGADALILRTQWLFGSNGRSFPRTMWERARAGLVTRVVDDQRGRPTYTRHLAAATWALIEHGARGLFHVTNEGEATWFELAARVFDAADARHLLSSCATSDYPTPAHRPAYSVLDNSRFKQAAQSALPNWTAALDEFMSSFPK